MATRTASTLSSLRQALSARRENICVEGRSGLDSGVSVFGYLFICLNMFLFGWLVVADRPLYYSLLREDYWVENLTALWFFLAGVLLFATAASERNPFRICVYVLGGIAMTFAAGEEISWGQRIFGFSTPDLLMEVNDQQEFNLHNITELKIYVLPIYGILMLSMATSVAFFSKRDSVLGFPLPSALLMLGAIATLQPWHPGSPDIFSFLFSKWTLLIWLFVIYALISKHAKLLIASLSTLSVVLAISYVDIPTRHVATEPREYLVGAVCLIISLELALARASLPRKLAALSGAKLSALFSRRVEHGAGSAPASHPASLDAAHGKRLPPLTWLAVCSLVFAGSIGLALLTLFEDDILDSKYRSITSGAPAASSIFDVYIGDGELIYAKQPCASADTEPSFFLHLLPADADDLPRSRRQYGFDNLDFRFDLNGAIFGEKCMTVAPLPRYAIASVRTGQYIPDEGRL